MPANREPHKIFAACLNFYRSNPGLGLDIRGSSITARLTDSLEGYLLGLSIMHQSIYPGWIADKDHPGFMIRVEPPVVMRAPYHLICAFPSETTLEAIWHLSQKVRTLPTSVLCLSGSSAILKSAVWVSDIDFCEYVNCSGDTFASAMSDKVQAKRELVCRQVKVGPKTSAYPSNVAEIEAHLRAVNPTSPDLSHAKIDFIGKPDGMRPTDISNLIIICDDKWKSASISRTFAAQEAQLDPVVAVPNALCDPYEIGRYISFVHEQAADYLTAENYPKALKRCLSLSRLCFLGPISEQITDFIETSPEFLERDIQAVSDLLAEIQNAEINLSKWVEELEAVKTDLTSRFERLQNQPNDKSIRDFSQTIHASLKRALAGQDLSSL